MSARRAVLDEIADERIAQAEAESAQRAAFEGAATREAEKRKRNLAEAKKIAREREKTLTEIQSALEALSSAGRRLLVQNVELQRCGVQAPIQAPATLRRLSKYLEAHLFHAGGNVAHFGDIRLHYSGRPKYTDDYVKPEADILTVAIQHMEQANETDKPTDQPE